MALKDLAKKIKVCKKCRLWKNRINAVPGEGNPRSKIMFIGEAPGSKEDETGKPFIGMAGVFLDTLFKKYKIKRKDTFITSVVKCRPPENRNPKTDEINTCAKAYLYKQIKAVKPKIIGPTIFAAFTGRSLAKIALTIILKMKNARIHPAIGERIQLEVTLPTSAH